MSMIGRGSRGAGDEARRRGGRGTAASPPGAGTRGLLAPRAVRVRNACVCIAADRLGLQPPTDADLRSLGDETSLRDAVEWWQGRASGAVATEPLPRSAAAPLVLRVAIVTAATVVGLALSYGRAQ